jgi:hypothetical protein
MTIHYEDKGKLFADVIKKEAVPIVVQTMTNVIRGKIHVLPGRRFKDEINRLEDFFAITDAVIYTPSGKELYRCEFLTASKDKIVWIFPEQELPLGENESNLLPD